MTAYDFDSPVLRRGTDSLKFDRAVSRHRSPDLIPLWVADMDFQLPPEITNPLAERAAHGIFGYTEPSDSYYQASSNWLENRHGWRPESSWYSLTPGVVFALAMAVKAYTSPGDAVLIQQPVYYPFSEVITDNGRVIASAPLTYEQGVYSIDFDAFRATAAESNAKLLLLCNPHNPVGRAWTREELEMLASICAELGIVVVSDEIHMDFNRPGFEHVSYATLGDAALNNALICTSAGKSFNLAGLQTSNIIIPNPSLRAKFNHQKAAAGYSQLNAMGLLATELCYAKGGPWFDALKEYLEGNWQLLESTLLNRAPQLVLVEPQSTYLAWIDCRSCGLFGKELRRFIEDEAGLWLDYGDMFGEDGDGFIRINIATQRSLLSKALNQLFDAIDAYQANKSTAN